MQRFNRVTAIILMACFFTLLAGTASAADLYLTGEQPNTIPGIHAPVQSVTTRMVNGVVLETVTSNPGQPINCAQTEESNPADNIVTFIAAGLPAIGNLPTRNEGSITMYGNVPGQGAQVAMELGRTTRCVNDGFNTFVALPRPNLRVLINGHDQTFLFQEHETLGRIENLATLNLKDGNYCRRTDSGTGLLLTVNNWATDAEGATSGTVRFNNDEFSLRGSDLIINAPIQCGQGSGNVDPRRFLMAFNSHTGAPGPSDPTQLAVFDHLSRGAGGAFWFTQGPVTPNDFFYLVTERQQVASGAGNEPVTGSFRTNGGLENIRPQLGLANEPVEFNLVGKVELVNPTAQQPCATVAVQSRNQAKITPGGAIGDYNVATDYCTKGQPFDLRIGRQNFSALLNADRPLGFLGDEVIFILPGKTIDTTPRCSAQEAAAFANQGTQYGYFMGACRKVGWVNWVGLTVQVNLPGVPGFY